MSRSIPLASAAAFLALGLAHGPALANSMELQVGGAVGLMPKYEGSKEYEVIGFPIVAPAGTGAKTALCSSADRMTSASGC